MSPLHIVSHDSEYENSDKLAIELMRYVRSMADDKHFPKEGTLLYELIKGERKNALCNDYALTLKRMILDMKLGYARTLNISFNPNGWDMHTLVEYFNEKQGEMIILDPTFSMIVKRKSDGKYATAEDIQRSTLIRDWSKLEFVQLEDREYDYYLDYPLLFLNLHRGSEDWRERANSPIPYLESIALPIEESPGFYLLQHVGQNKNDGSNTITEKVEVNGELQTIVFDGIDKTSKVFGAASINIPLKTKQNIVAYKPKRFVFRD